MKLPDHVDSNKKAFTVTPVPEFDSRKDKVVQQRDGDIIVMKGKKDAVAKKNLQAQ